MMPWESAFTPSIRLTPFSAKRRWKLHLFQGSKNVNNWVQGSDDGPKQLKCFKCNSLWWVWFALYVSLRELGAERFRLLQFHNTDGQHTLGHIIPKHLYCLSELYEISLDKTKYNCLHHCPVHLRCNVSLQLHPGNDFILSEIKMYCAVFEMRPCYSWDHLVRPI